MAEAATYDPIASVRHLLVRPAPGTCEAARDAALARVAELEAALAERDATIATQSGQIERMQETMFLEHQARKNPHLRAEAPTLIALKRRHEAARDVGDVDDDGFVLARRKDIGGNAGRDPRSVTRDLRRLEKLGLVEVRRDRSARETETVDSDGVIATGIDIVTDVYVRPVGGDAVEMMRRAAAVTADERKAVIEKANTHGGARCPDHPHAAIRRESAHYCSACDRLLDTDITMLRPAADLAEGGMDILTTPPAPDADDAADPSEDLAAEGMDILTGGADAETGGGMDNLSADSTSRAAAPRRWAAGLPLDKLSIPPEPAPLGWLPGFVPPPAGGADRWTQ